jgi:hypothetical protein
MERMYGNGMVRLRKARAATAEMLCDALVSV